ncbi:MAG TPA: hypothetical protein VKG82_07895 [Solirubrobacteraceae bacterium]|nr:hypothetical protein [Solirubrobacteraceae bacterium]
MARAIALVPDLLFGSRLQGACAASGLELELLGDERQLRELLERRPAGAGDVLVIDLTDPDLDGPALVQSLRDGGELGPMGTLGFYAHVDVAARERAERAGFDLVVARSRMAREGERLLAGVARDSAAGA